MYELKSPCPSTLRAMFARKNGAAIGAIAARVEIIATWPRWWPYQSWPALPRNRLYPRSWSLPTMLVLGWWPTWCMVFHWSVSTLKSQW